MFHAAESETSKAPIWSAVSDAVTATADALGLRTPREEIESLATAARCVSGRDLQEVLDQLVRIGNRARGSPAWDQLALLIDRLDDAARDRIMLAGHPHWPQVCQRLATSPSAIERAAASRLAAHSDHAEVILELPSLLSDVEPEVSRAAAEAVVTLARRSHEGIGLPAGARHALHAAIAECVVSYDRHRRREALGAALATLATPAAIKAAPASLRTLLSSDDHAAHLSLRSVIRHSRAPGDEARAWVWLAYPPFQSACLDRLGKIDSAGAFADVLANAHLLANPDRRAALSRRGADPRAATERLVVDQALLELIDSPGLKHAPSLAAAFGGDPARCAETLVADERVIVRWALSRHLTQHGHAPGVPETLADLCFDADARVARSALLGLAAGATDRHSRAQASLWMIRLRRSGHARVRHAAHLLSPALSPWEADHSASRLLARRMMRGDRDGFITSLRDRLRFDRGEVVPMDAMRTARRLGLLPAIQMELIDLVRGSSAGSRTDKARLHLAASAVLMLADVTTPEADAAVAEALTHTDPRVRANAVDGLSLRIRRGRAGTGASAAQRIIELKSDAHHRVRASAVRAELLALCAAGTPAAPEGALLPLLKDSRPMHRIAGLWLAGRLPTEMSRFDSGSLSAAVAEIGAGEPVAEIRARAARCSARLMLGGARPVSL